MTPAPAPPGASNPPPGTILLTNKLMSAIPALADYAGVAITDVLSLEQWNECFTQSLIQHKMHKPSEPHKEPLYVLILWLRNLATTHSTVTPEIALQAQKHLNIFGRWPLTVAFFVTSSSSAGNPLLPAGTEPKPGEVPNGLRGDTYQAAKRLRDYLVEAAKDTLALPMVPLYWQDNIALRVALSKVLRPGLTPAASPQGGYFAGAVPPRSSSTSPELHTEMSALRLNTASNGGGSASTDLNGITNPTTDVEKSA